MREQERLGERMEDFRRVCIARGIKLTHQRLEIFRELASTDEHPDVETIYRKVKARIPTISLDTVYRNLRFMAEEGLIAVVGLSNERQRFDANLSEHHHFMCIRCGAIRDFSSEKMNKLTPPKEAEEIGRPLSFRLEVKGICRECEKILKCIFTVSVFCQDSPHISIYLTFQSNYLLCNLSLTNKEYLSDTNRREHQQ